MTTFSPNIPNTNTFSPKQQAPADEQAEEASRESPLGAGCPSLMLLFAPYRRRTDPFAIPSRRLIPSSVPSRIAPQFTSQSEQRGELSVTEGGTVGDPPPMLPANSAFTFLNLAAQFVLCTHSSKTYFLKILISVIFIPFWRIYSQEYLPNFMDFYFS